MKIFSAEQVREADRFTIENEPVASIDLMERAARAFVRWFMNKYDKEQSVAVVCGPGNNGGDGLAVSRLLHEKGYRVQPWVLKFSSGGSDDFRANYERLSAIVTIHHVKEPGDFKVDDQQPDILVDAIFGSGLTRPVEGPYADIVHRVNASPATVVSIDIPSGLFCDRHSSGEAIVEADHVVSFQLPKLAFLMPENGNYVRQWSIVDIGLSRSFLKGESSSHWLLRKPMVRKYINPRKKFDHKGTFGRALIVSGSYGKMGAAVLCARACQRTGAGLTTVHIPSIGYDIVQTAVPEAMVSADVNARFVSAIADADQYDAVGIGPGIDTHADTVAALERLISGYPGSIVLDADALNILAIHKDLQDRLPPRTILTPHPGEFKRLVGGWEDDFDRLDRLKALAKRLDVCVVLKGYHTTIAMPGGKVYFNTTGNPGMATGGSGDVLTGMLTGLLAQGHGVEEAALLGVWLHGVAGDLACGQIGEEALIASDIIDNIQGAYRELKA